MRLSVLRGDDCQSLVVAPEQPLRSAMQLMNATGRTLVLVARGENLEGVISDGDIRRHLAEGGAVDDAVSVALNPTPITLEASTKDSEIRSFMIRRGLDFVPLVRGSTLVALAIYDRLPPSRELSAVVLAGGVGARLAPLTHTCPKPLLQLGGTPILGHIISHLRDNGVGRLVLSVSYLAHMIVDYCGDGSRWDTYVEYVHETKRLGTGGPLSLVDSESLSDPFLVLNGDVVSDIDVQDLLHAHSSRGWDATMAVHRHNLVVPYGVVQSQADDGEFLGIAEKPVFPLNVNAGIYMLSKSALAVVPHNEFYDMPTMFDDLAAHGLRGGVYLHAGRWIDLGTMNEYERAKQMFEDRDS